MMGPVKLETEVEIIRTEIKDYPQCDKEELDECVDDAIAGIQNVDSRGGILDYTSGIAEMKGEWTIRYNRPKSDTEKEFAERFIGVLGEALNGDVRIEDSD